MNRDFHYNVISLVAQSAGFAQKEATLVAHASQYTDDCTFYEPLRMDLAGPGVVGPDIRYREWERILQSAFPPVRFASTRKYAFEKDPGHFDPVCTAHYNLEARLKSLITSPRQLWREISRLKDENALKKVYVCFHFVPDTDTSSPRKKFYTEPDCGFLREYLNALMNLLRSSPAGTHRRRQVLVALGVALHSYADTWSHDGFSGLWSSKDNDIKNLKVARRYGFKDKGYMPDIGHLEAGDWVDRTEAELDFEFCNKNGSRPKKVTQRQNPVVFTRAADRIHRVLGGGELPEPVKKFLFDSFRMELEESARCRWMETRINQEKDLQSCLPGLHISPYNRELWINELVQLPPDLAGPMSYAYRPESDWFLFQTAALAQRHMILAHCEKSIH